MGEVLQKNSQDLRSRNGSRFGPAASRVALSAGTSALGGLQYIVQTTQDREGQNNLCRIGTASKHRAAGEFVWHSCAIIVDAVRQGFHGLGGKL